MTGKTPLYQLPYLTPSDPVSRIATHSKDSAEAIENALNNRGVTPSNSSLENLTRRLSRLETPGVVIAQANANAWHNDGIENGTNWAPLKTNGDALTRSSLDSTKFIAARDMFVAITFTYEVDQPCRLTLMCRINGNNTAIGFGSNTAGGEHTYATLASMVSLTQGDGLQVFARTNGSNAISKKENVRITLVEVA